MIRGACEAPFNLHSALEELRNASVIRQSPDELLEAMAGTEPISLDVSDPNLLSRAPSSSGMVVEFDTETGVVPCDHAELIAEFGRHSGGKFSPECPIQIWEQEDDDDYDGPYTVLFLHRNRLYRFEAENYGDYYDVEAVARAANAVVEHEGQKERYICLAPNGQCASFVFADPEPFAAIAHKYGLTLSQDSSQAMRAGREFEVRVRGNSSNLG